jgi:hypothetical protein
MKLKVNIRECIEENASTYDDQIRVSADIGLDDLFDAIPEEDEIDVDIHALLAENRQIAHVWGIDDVQEIRPDLDDDAAWDVLQGVRGEIDSDHGITRATIARAARELYPEQQERHWQGRIDVRIADTDGCGRDEVLTRLRDMAARLAKDMPGVEAEIDPASVRLLDSDETAGE